MYKAGNKDKAIEMLESVKDSIINAYEIKTGLSRAKISHLMDAETWMDAHKAVELGFADDILSRLSLADDPDEDDDEDEDETEDHAPMMYSEAKVVNSLMEKIAKKCRIDTKKTDNRVNADALLERLNLMKNWR